MPLLLDDEAEFWKTLKPIKLTTTEEKPTTGFTIKRTPIVVPKPQPVSYEKPPLKKILCAVDVETDPFKKQRNPKPFAVGLSVTDYGYFHFWGNNCVDQFFEKLQEIKDYFWPRELVVYAHNGGKFDFVFFIDYIQDGCKPFCIDKRIVKIDFMGIEFRDSYSILPVPLRKLKGKKHAKKEIDFAKLEASVREQHKEEILEYLQEDCDTLLEAVSDFINRFGNHITIASTALPLLQSFHGFDRLTKEEDDLFRPYYAGGRVECFQRGIIEGKFIMVDCNSMYPAAMSNLFHPVDNVPRFTRNLDREDVFFADIIADSRGALGWFEGNKYTFKPRKGRFLATIHEIRAGVETGTLTIDKVNEAWFFHHYVKFTEFVDHFYAMRLAAKAENDLLGIEFYKLILNSAYGKFGMDSSNYEDHVINPVGELTHMFGDIKYENYTDDAGNMRRKLVQSPDGWKPIYVSEAMRHYARKAVSTRGRYINVATAASITGAARSVLQRAICSAEDVVYCDTDSLICRSFNGDIDPSRLGAWKIEAEGDAVVIGGKKLYAFLTATPSPDREAVEINGRTMYALKKAHKGAQLSAEGITRIARGETIEYEFDAPTIDMFSKAMKYQKRKIRATA